MHTKNFSTGMTDLGNDRVSSRENSSSPVRKLQFSHRETGAVKGDCFSLMSVGE